MFSVELKRPGWPLEPSQNQRAAEWLLLVAGAEQGGWVLATEGSLGVRAPDCTLGSPLSNPPDLQVGKGQDSPVRPELLWAPWSLKKIK